MTYTAQYFIQPKAGHKYFIRQSPWKHIFISVMCYLRTYDWENRTCLKDSTAPICHSSLGCPREPEWQIILDPCCSWASSRGLTTQKQTFPSPEKATYVCKVHLTRNQIMSAGKSLRDILFLQKRRPREITRVGVRCRLNPSQLLP